MLPALDNLSDLLFDARTSLAEETSWQGEFKSRRKNLEPYWGQLSLSKVYADDGSLTHYIGIYEDVTASKQAQQHIERLAFRDNLTGLGNRYAFIRSLEATSASTPANRSACCWWTSTTSSGSTTASATRPATNS